MGKINKKHERELRVREQLTLSAPQRSHDRASHIVSIINL